MSKLVSQNDKSSEVDLVYSLSNPIQLSLECMKSKALCQIQKTDKFCPLKPCMFKYKSKVYQKNSKTLKKLKKMSATKINNAIKSTAPRTFSENVTDSKSLLNNICKLDAAAIELASLSIKTTVTKKECKKFDDRYEIPQNLTQDLNKKINSKSIKEKTNPTNCKPNTINEQISEVKVDHGGDYEVLDLTSLIENCLYFPKEMSVMAQAMYG